MANIVNQAQTRVTVDGQQAANQLSVLEKRAQAYRDALVAANKAGDDKAVDKASKGLRQVEKEMRTIIRSSFDVNKVMSNLSDAGPKELKKALSELNKQLNSGAVARNSKEWDELQRKIRLVRGELEKINAENSLSGSDAGDGAKNFAGMVTAFIASITGLSFAFQKLIEDLAKMDDVYADVMKTTGMTRDQVLDLNESFKKMDTRTSREELNSLASDAGKLGLTGKKDILDFVDAGNQINVALGEDLGEGAIKNIGKLTDVFALSTKELDNLDIKGKMLAIGSAINELGASSTASEGYMVNFAQRLGGVAAQAGISIQNILGYASALDQSGQAVEMSATAFQNFIMKLMSEPSKFAKIAGLEVKAFNDLLSKDTNAAIKQVLMALSEKGGFQALIPMFQEMGLDGARAVGVLSAMATNIGKISEAQEISNKAFADGTSLTNEYNVKNNNLQATLDKARKALSDVSLELGERLAPSLMSSTNYMIDLIKILPAVIDFFSEYGKYIVYLAAAYISYIAGVKLALYWEQAKNAVLILSRIITLSHAMATAVATGNTTRAIVAQRLYYTELSKGNLVTKAYILTTSLLSAAKYALTGNLARARVALQAFNVTMKANPVGAFLSVIVLLGGAIYTLYQHLQSNNKELDKNKELQKSIAEETKKYTEEIAREQSAFNSLMLAIINANEKSTIRKTLIKEIKEQYPQYLKYIDMEVLSNRELEAVLRNVNKQYEKRYDIAALKGRTDAEDKIITGLKDKQISIREELDKLYSNPRTNAYDEERIKELEKEYDSLDKQIEDSLKKVSNYNKQIADVQEGIAKENSIDGLMELIETKTKQIESKKEFISVPGLSPKQKAKLEKEINDLSDEVTVHWMKINKMGEEMAETEKKTPTTPTAPTTPTGDSKASDQRSKVQAAMRKLEIEDTKARTKILQDFRDGEIKSEFEKDQKLLEQQNKYAGDRKAALKDLLKSVSVSTVKNDINKQISEIDNQVLQSEIKRQAEIKKILLDADPAAAEQEAYERRLQELGLFGVDREKLTKDQLSALELLEEQHHAKMSKIERPKVTREIKTQDDNQARESQLLSQEYAKGLMSERQYQHQLVLIQIAYAQKKLQIDGLTEEQKLQIQKETEDKLRKLNEENSEIQARLDKKKKLENLTDARDAELSFLDQMFDENLRNTDAYEQARLSIVQKYALLEEEANKAKQQRMIETAQFGLDSMQQLLSSYSSYIQAANEAETAAINKKYEAQIKAAGNNSKRVKKLEEQRDKELKEANRANEERSFKIQIAQALASTAQSAINAYSSTAAIPIVGPALAPIAAGVATAAGLINVAAIKKQHEAAMANYWDGGYTPKGNKYDVAGYVHRGEFVATQETLANPNARAVVDVIDMAQRRNTVSSLKSSDFATAMEYNERVSMQPLSGRLQNIVQPDNDNSDYLLSVLSDVVQVQMLLRERLNQPFVTVNTATGDKGIKKALSDLDKMDKNIRRK
ncbi:phage tail tape measure protein [Dysgonomonas macrotermitis]|uniref:Phage tail tape measure protein, TP901 family, core region n=1 Tax=Dysgonomonas macrotermitis TaxID=1346286 RepID=A0A1M4UHF2_9BACT|nr:phage tail tape measure protein [Dysgonomonas macrotermitis]SHE56212.1 phage tail tape measure protein, TP901 family, core region [Dysgonomonas macrotermitis]